MKVQKKSSSSEILSVFSRVERQAQCVEPFGVMRRAIYPGSFDPVTNGHLDVIERACTLFDEVIVAVAINDEKQPLFAPDERLAMLRRAITYSNVRVAPMEGLLVEFAAFEKAHATAARDDSLLENVDAARFELFDE